MLASVSGMIKSRSLSPADRILRPSDFAAPVPLCGEMPKLADNSVR